MGTFPGFPKLSEANPKFLAGEGSLEVVELLLRFSSEDLGSPKRTPYKDHPTPRRGPCFGILKL